MSLDVSVPWRHQIGAKDLAGDMSASPPQSIHSGGTAQGGPPPPPPPPPPMLHSGHIPAIRIKTELNEPREIPSTIQNAMATKDKKPFTYLPGGLDLSEIRSPRMQRRLERNAQTPPSPEQVPQRSPEYQSLPPPLQQVVKQNFEQKPVSNVRSAAERVCLLPQVQHQPQLNKAPTPWMQKAAQIQSNPAPWAQNRKEYITDQVDKSEERVLPVRVETIRQVPSQPLKNNINHSYDSEPIQGRSFKVLQQITEPKSVYDGSQPYNTQSLPLSELRKLQLNDDDQSFMNRVKSQVDDDKFLHNETDPRYRGASIPSRSFRMLQTLTNSAPVPMDNNKQTIPINNYVSVKPIESKIYVPPSERPVGLEPHKYTGGSIPSRSFRMLQAMTGQNNEEDDENDLRNQSISPYPFSCPEFWQHYNYLKEFHDRHMTESDQQQQQTAQSNDITVTMPCNDVAYTAHVLNTIDEEETAEDYKQSCETAAAVVSATVDDGNDKNGSDSAECEVTVTIKLPTNRRANIAENEMTVDSPVDFWQQINDGGPEARDEAETSSSSTAGSDSESSENATLQSPSGTKSEDADSGITCASSADFSRLQQQRQTSEIQHVNGDGDGGSAKKYYQRTCTHSRLFDFLRDGDKQSTDVPMMQSSCTSGYSSAATTPTTPSVRGKYESDTNRTEYDNYYKSWEYACPYFGYDILPSKAFKAIMQGDCSSTTAALKFKCPKIPTENDES